MCRSRRRGIVCGLALALGVALAGRAEERQAAAVSAPAGDPRVGLRAGLRDAGVAARHMQLVASLPRPAGFFDPEAPSGVPSPPEAPSAPAAAAPTPAPTSTPAPAPTSAPANAPRRGRPAGDLSFANSDLAFARDHLFVGSFHGFNVYTIEDPRRPRLLTSVVCPGGQGDLSVHGRLLFMSVEQTRGRVDCGTGGVQGPVSAERFRGIRIFDVSDVRQPRQVAAVQTCRGSHTHTLIVDPDDTANVYIYASGVGEPRSGDELAGCSGQKPEENPETALFSIDVIQVPLLAPETSRIVSRPRIFADPATGAVAGLWAGGDHGPGTQKTSVTNECHDITAYPAAGLAAGACAGNGILLDISDPVRPVRLDQVIDPNFAYWHSATFNNDGTKVIFTDEWGGGTRPRCRATDRPDWGANAIFDIADGKLRFGSYYKMPAPQTESENCVAHNGSIIPVPGRDIMVQGWYQGGISVFDFTDSRRPIEIAFFDRGPVAADLVTAGFWAAYWYNGHIYGAEIVRGLDVFRLTPSEHLSAHEIEAASLVQFSDFNPQFQPRATWPAEPAVAHAYLEQLVRSGAVDPRRGITIRAAIDRLARLRTGRERGAPAARLEADALAASLTAAAATAAGPDAARLRSLGEALSSRAAALGAPALVAP
jgi:hypothetical protein